jgi:hypothetical protein
MLYWRRRLLPLVEDFYTIQGEGFHDGTRYSYAWEVARGMFVV